MDAEVTRYIRRMRMLSRRTRNVFLAAVALCTLLACNVTFLNDWAQGHMEPIRAAFGPLLLWSLTAAAYAFYSLATANSRLTRKVVDILAADRARAMKQIKMIKSRLSS